MKPRRLPHDPTEQEIQHAAYFLWEAEGRPAGRDLEIWLAARERLKHAARRTGHARDITVVATPPPLPDATAANSSATTFHACPSFPSPSSSACSSRARL